MPILAFLLGCVDGSEDEDSGPECTEGYEDYDFRNGQFYGPLDSYGYATVEEGFVATGIGDIDYTGGDARLSTYHHRDVDAEDDGVIEGLFMILFTPDHACELRLLGNGLPSVDEMAIWIASDCAGWSDAEEDHYNSEWDPPATVEVDHRVTGDVAEACFETELRPEGIVALEGAGGTMTVDLSALVIRGSVYSYAIPEGYD